MVSCLHTVVDSMPTTSASVIFLVAACVLVTPASSEQYALESARHYDECYGLAFAQQLKNKDIPEGGSKAVNLINVSGLSESGKNFVMRKSVKAFTDTILDLIVDSKDINENMVDYLGKKEVLYLGPDEQVIPEDINWIVRRAALRGYETPNAFMSSKPRCRYQPQGIRRHIGGCQRVLGRCSSQGSRYQPEHGLLHHQDDGRSRRRRCR